MKKKKFNLKGFFVTNGIKQNELAETLKLHRTTLNLKLNGKSRFTLDEYKKLIKKYQNIGLKEEYFI